MAIGKADVTALLGPVDDELAAAIVATGATQEELAQAWAWLHNEEALVSEGHPFPDGRVAALIDLLDVEPDED